MTWNVLIVDDERPARVRVRRLLSTQTDFRVVAEAADGQTALARILAGDIHLMFLDVQMPQMDGIKLLHELPTAQIPVTVFLTASRSQAVNAFELSAVDSLSKPVDALRMSEALQRARARLVENSKAVSTSGKLARLLVRKGTRELLINVETINWIEADGNYVTLHCDKEQHFIRESIGELEHQLDKHMFLRINRSALVNVERVTELRHSGKTLHVVLTTCESLPATVGLRELRERMQFR